MLKTNMSREAGSAFGGKKIILLIIVLALVITADVFLYLNLFNRDSGSDLLHSETNVPLSDCIDDEDCKIIYSSCSCEAVPIIDPRDWIDNTGLPVCEVNQCDFKYSGAGCQNNSCVLIEKSSLTNQNTEGAPQTLLTAADLMAQVKSGSVLAESPAPEIPLPAGIISGQIMKYFKLGNLYLALVLQPSMNIWLPDVPANYTASFTGVLAAKEDDKAWTKLLELKDQVQTDKNNPYYLWLTDNKIFLSVVDQNGAGSGEGMMKILTLDDRNNWVLDSCYYFNGNYTDGDYFIASSSDASREPKPLSDCSNLSWK